jgi:uncharacterized protein
MTTHSETINRLYAAFASGDIPTVLAAFAPDISWTEAEGFPYGGTYIGPEAVLHNVFMKLGSEWDGFAAVSHELVAEGETVVALGQYSGTYKATGKSFRAPFVHVWKFKDSGIASFTQYTDTAVVQSALK